MIDPELTDYISDWDRLAASFPKGASIAVTRAIMESEAARRRVPLPAGVATDVIRIPGHNRDVRVRRFRLDSAPVGGALVYMHGGGWVRGSPETHEAITAAICHRTGWTVLSVDYALAPENPYPAGLDDCESVLRWASTAGGPVAVGGDSAGANLAAALSLRLRGSSVAPVGQILFYPALDCVFDRPSCTENADGPILKTADIPRVLAMYCPDPDQRCGMEVAPIRASTLAGLPPAFVAVAEHDPLRDEGFAFAVRLDREGGSVDLHLGEGLVHSYLRAIDRCAAADRELNAACRWLVGILLLDRGRADQTAVN